MTAEDRIREYYDALRKGEALPPFFAEDESVVKFGITERLTGYGAVAAGLREQTRTTEDWQVESHALRVTERDGYAWFSDDVDLSWTDVEENREYNYETRWSGTLERRDGTWLFVGMHVSTTPE